MTEDVLLEVASRTDYRGALKRWANLLVKMGLTDTFGVYVKAMPGGRGSSDMGIYIARHHDTSTPGQSFRSHEL